MKIVLHSHWTRAETLFVWAEWEGNLGKSGRPGGKHPGAMPAHTLRTFLQQAAGVGYVTRWKPESRTLKLPTQGNRPVPSKQILGAEAFGGDGEHREEIWEVSGYALDRLASADILLHPPRHEAWSQAFHFLARLSDFVEELCARGRILPTLVEGPNGFSSRWLPYFVDEEDLARREVLRKTIPPILLAEQPSQPARGRRRKRLIAGGQTFSAEECIDSVMGRLTDLMVRPVLQEEGGRQALGELRSDPSLAARWVTSLVELDGQVQGSSAGLAGLSEGLAAWQGSFAPERELPFELVLRLGEPLSEEQDWGLAVWVRSKLETSLRYASSEVFDPDPILSRELGRFQEPLQNWLEAELRALAAVFPPLSRLSHDPTRSSLDLDTSSAYMFLKEASGRLAARGVVLEVPDWWQGARQKIGLQVAAWPSHISLNPRDRPLEMRKLAHFTWKLALDDEHALSEDELRQLAKRKLPLVRLRGQWIEVPPEAHRAAMTMLEDSYRAGQDASVLEVLRRAAGFEAPPWKLPVQGFDRSSVLFGLLGGPSESERKIVARPKGFQGTLRSYQSRGVAWLLKMAELGLGACLADEMGLGKTVQVLALLAECKARSLAHSKEELGTYLLVAPTSVLSVWETEAKRFCPDLKVFMHHGANRPKKGPGFEKVREANDLILTGYPLLAKDRSLLTKVHWRGVFFDEAQALKNPRTQASRAAQKLSSDSKIALTGTPVENRLADLWALFHVLEPGLLGTKSQFRGRFEIPIERHGDEESSALLRKLTAPFVLRRTKDEVLTDLPEKEESRLFCSLTREQVTLYQAVLDDMLSKVEESHGMERRGLVLTTLTKLRQVCNHPLHLLQQPGPIEGRSGKLEKLKELLDDAMAQQEKVLVFTQYRVMGEILVECMEQRYGKKILFLHGGVSRIDRQKMVQRFQSDPDTHILLLSLKAGGTGLTLTAASRVIHYDRWWNPAVEDQATDRAHRIGQTRAVQVRKLVCRGTLEERLDRILRKKRKLAGRIVRSGESWITELSDHDLREMVSLAAPASPGEGAGF